ncbi:MAG: outer membrane beta-barrel protein [Oligoflexia bacterium]|nr:outer membrane beta-barrel protein [Oligoflexia bacterium]
MLIFTPDYYDNKVMKAVLIMGLISINAFAGYYEISAKGSYSNYKNTEDTFTRSYSFGASVAYRFISASAIEIAYTKTFQKQTAPYSNIQGIIQVASVSILGYLLGKEYMFQPFVKIGGGYMFREYSYKYDLEGIPVINTRSESASLTFGGGIRYLLTGNLAIEGSAIGYLTDFEEDRPFIHHTVMAGITVIF